MAKVHPVCAYVWVWLLLCAMPLVVTCSGGKALQEAQDQKREPPTFPVQVQAVETRSVEYSVRAVGSLQAYETIQITARVAGAIESVRFQEGDQVRAGQVLAEIEPERYRVALAAAQAAYERARAAEEEARAGLARRERLAQRRAGLIVEEELDAWHTRQRLSAAEAAQAKANLDLARMNYLDARVRSPASGIIQTRSVNIGQYVQAGTVLATMVRREPLRLAFSIPEGEAASLQPGMKVFFSTGETDRVYEARIRHVAIAADPQSRMVPILAQITDPHRGGLRPGAFAQVRVPIRTVTAAPVVPQIAVRPSERGFLVYVVEEGIARERLVKLGLRTERGEVEVRSGLKPGERLVVRGAEALRDGAAVRVTPVLGAPTEETQALPTGAPQ